MWSHVESGFDAANETINFGARTLAEGDSLYETCTLAIVKTSGQVEKSPTVCCVYQNDKLLLSIDNTFRILSNNCTDLDLYVSFENIISSFKVSSDGNILLLYFVDGNINCLYIPSKQLICSTCITEKEIECLSIFYFENRNSFSFVILTKNNEYRLKINNSVDEFKNGEKIEVDFTFDKLKNINSILTYISNEDYSYFISNQNCFTDCGNFVVALNDEGSIISICKLTKLVFKIYEDGYIKDLIHLQNLESALSNHSLMIKTLINGDNHIKLLSYPNFDVIYNLKTSQYIYFVDLKNEDDKVMFIEGICSENSEFVDELRIKLITESIPEIKLQRLLRKKLFDEAKKLSKLFQFSLQPIFEAEAEEFIIESNFQINNLEKFLQILDNIKDVYFVVENCLNVTATTIHDCEQILEYADKRLHIILQNNPDDSEFLRFKTKITRMLFMLNTFKILYCREIVLNPATIVDEWIQFSEANLCQKMYQFLRNQEIYKCSILFNRLQYTDDLDLNVVDTILLSLPIQLPLMSLLPLLQQIIFYAVHLQQEALPIVINWIQHVIMNLETSLPDWLEYAITFIEQIQSYIFSNDVQSLNFQKYLSENGSLFQFCKLYSILKELSLLKRNFGIKLFISEYMEKPELIVQTILDKMNSSQVKNVMNNFVYEFCKRHRINSDEVLSQYIKFSSDTQKWYCEESIILNLIPFINSNTLKMEIILVVLETAEVPWNKNIDDLANQALEDCYLLTSKIKNLKQNIPWKLLLKKYSIKDNPTFTDHEVLLILRKILLLSKSDISNDLNIILEKYPHLHEYCYNLWFKDFLQKGNLADCFKILDKLDENTLKFCFKSVLITTETYLFSKIFQNVLENYINILKPLLYRIKKYVPDHEFIVYENQVQKLKNVFVLKTCYNCNEIENLNFDKPEIRIKLVHRIITSLNDKKINWLQAIKEIESVASVIGDTLEECFFEFINQCNSLDTLFIKQITKKLIKNDSTAINLTTMAMLLMKLIGSNKLIENDHATVCLSKDTEVVTILQLISKLVVKACAKSNRQELLISSDMLIWTNICYYFRNNDTTNLLSQWKYTNIFQPEIINSVSFRTIELLKDIFDLFLNISFKKTKFASHLLDNQMCSQSIEDFIMTQMKVLLERINELHMKGNDLIVYQILNILIIKIFSITSNEFSTMLNQQINYHLKTCINNLLLKVVVTREIDEIFAFSLFMTSNYQYKNWFKMAIIKYKTSMRKLNNVANLICNYSEFLNISKISYEEAKNQCNWSQKLLQYSIPHNNIFFMKPLQILTDYLLKCDNFDLKTMQAFCKDFKLDIQNYLGIYLRNTLLTWKPNYKDITKDVQLKLYNKCEDIFNLIEDKAIAIENLKSVWDEVSYYQYEIYICILDIYDSVDANCKNADKRLLLSFLQTYTRISKPQQKEIEDWQMKYQFAREIDPLSEFRLPYMFEMFTKEFWEIIRPEINLMTYNTWLKISSIPLFHKNYICVYAIKGTLRSGILNSKDQIWCLNSKHESLLESMQLCVNQITDLKFATAILNQAVGVVSGGADQVAIAKMCWEKAKQWSKCTTQDNKASVKCSEVKIRYLHCLTKHILFMYNIGNDKYLNLIDNIEQLIKELYQDESIVARTKEAALFYPDINAAVDELTRELEIDSVEIRKSLVVEFLQKSCKGVNFDETFCNNTIVSSKSSTDDNANSDYLTRVVYICESSQKEELISLLYQITFEQLDDTVTTFSISLDLYTKVQAFQCLLTISDNFQSLENEINESPSLHLEKLKILIALESVGIILTVKKLDKCNIVDLCWNILRTYFSNMIMVKCSASLCSVYKIWDLQLWNKILECFINLKMLTELEKWLPKLFTYCYIPGTDCVFIKAWRFLINKQFLMSLENGKNYTQGLFSLQACPIVSKLEQTVEDIFQIYFEKELYEICAVLLLYIQSDTKRNEFLLNMMPTMGSSFFKKVDTFTTQGILNIDCVRVLINNFQKQF